MMGNNPQEYMVEKLCVCVGGVCVCSVCVVCVWGMCVCACVCAFVCVCWMLLSNQNFGLK